MWSLRSHPISPQTCFLEQVNTDQWIALLFSENSSLWNTCNLKDSSSLRTFISRIFVIWEGPYLCMFFHMLTIQHGRDNFDFALNNNWQARQIIQISCWESYVTCKNDCRNLLKYAITNHNNAHINSKTKGLNALF